MASLSLRISTHPQPAGKLKLGAGGGGKVNFVASLSLPISTYPQPLRFEQGALLVHLYTDVLSGAIKGKKKKGKATIFYVDNS